MEHILEEINPFITEELFWKNSQKWIIWQLHLALLAQQVQVLVQHQRLLQLRQLLVVGNNDISKIFQKGIKMENIIDIESVSSTDLFVEEQLEMDNMAGTWGSASTFSSASTFGGCAATASSGGSASSFGQFA